MVEIGAREVISIIKRKGIKISYGYLLQLTRRGDVPVIRTEEWPEETNRPRIQVEEEGECKLGYSCEHGCTIMECKACGKLEHFPWM